MKFSLRALMVLVFVAAVGCGVFFALPPLWSLGALAAMGVLAPGAIVSAICYCRGYARAFAIGCAAVAWAPAIYHSYMVVMIAVGGLSSTSEIVEAATLVKISYAVVLGTILASGLTSMAVRWLALGSERRGRLGASVPRMAPPRPHAALPDSTAKEGAASVRGSGA